jgi:hypothetical protein
LSAANAAFDRMLPAAFRCCEDWAPTEVFVLWYIKSIWPFWLWAMGRKDDARAVLHAGPFEALEPMYDWIAENTGPGLMAPRKIHRDADEHASPFTADDFHEHARFMEVLLADEAPPASSTAELPNPQDAAMLGVCSRTGDSEIWGAVSSYHFSTRQVCMLAHERVGNSDQALACAEITLKADRAHGGTDSRWHHAFAHACRGRILASQGSADEAEVAFEAAVEATEADGLHFFTAIWLRDLCKHVLDGAGRGEEGQKRLAEAVSRLACSVEDLAGVQYP